MSSSGSASAAAANPGSGGGGSKKEDERRKQFVTAVLGLPATVLGNHPIIATMVAKYVKVPGHEDKAAFQLDLLRMLSMARRSSVDQ
nr:small capsid protein [Murid betaherpesvirus 2]